MIVRVLPPLWGLRFALLGKFTSFLFPGLSGVIRQPITHLDHVISSIAEPLRVRANLEQRFGASHVTAESELDIALERQLVPSSRFSLAVIAIVSGSVENIVDDFADGGALRFGRPLGFGDTPLLNRECLGGLP